MERLTKKHYDGNGYYMACSEHCNKECFDCKEIDKIIDRLGTYEETGLEPEEIYEVRFLIAAQRDPQKLARLRELVLADQDGRLVVLPCKVGDTIYYTREGCPIVEPLKVRTFFVGDPTRRGEILHLHMIRTDKFDVSIDALGKTVFLTREEAEAVLKGGEG